MIKFVIITVIALLNELKVALGGLISPGSVIFFISTFFFILFSNLIGLLPYVFTSTRHLSFTLSLSLPL